MLPAELLASPVPPFLVVVVVLAGVGIRMWKRRDDSRQSEWDRLRDLLDDLREQQQRQDRLITDLTADNARLREALHKERNRS